MENPVLTQWGLEDVGQLGPAVRLGWFLPRRTEVASPTILGHWRVLQDPTRGKASFHTLYINVCVCLFVCVWVCVYDACVCYFYLLQFELKMKPFPSVSVFLPSEAQDILIRERVRRNNHRCCRIRRDSLLYPLPLFQFLLRGRVLPAWSVQSPSVWGSPLSIPAGRVFRWAS